MAPFCQIPRGPPQNEEMTEERQLCCCPSSSFMPWFVHCAKFFILSKSRIFITRSCFSLLFMFSGDMSSCQLPSTAFLTTWFPNSSYSQILCCTFIILPEHHVKGQSVLQPLILWISIYRPIHFLFVGSHPITVNSFSAIPFLSYQRVHRSSLEVCPWIWSYLNYWIFLNQCYLQ